MNVNDLRSHFPTAIGEQIDLRSKTDSLKRSGAFFPAELTIGGVKKEAAIIEYM